MLSSLFSLIAISWEALDNQKGCQVEFVPRDELENTVMR